MYWMYESVGQSPVALSSLIPTLYTASGEVQSIFSTSASLAAAELTLMQSPGLADEGATLPFWMA
jgi:hypothetical protein